VRAGCRAAVDVGARPGPGESCHRRRGRVRAKLVPELDPPARLLQRGDRQLELDRARAGSRRVHPDARRGRGSLRQIDGSADGVG